MKKLLLLSLTILLFSCGDNEESCDENCWEITSKQGNDRINIGGSFRYDYLYSVRNECTGESQSFISKRYSRQSDAPAEGTTVCPLSRIKR